MAFKILSNLFVKLVRAHLNALFAYLDPVKNNSLSECSKSLERSKSGLKWDFKFLFPLACMLITTFYGNLYLEYEATGRVHLDLINTTTPYTFYHQIFPRLMWPQSDISITIASLGAVTMYASFLRNPFTVVRYQAVDGRDLTRDSILKIGSQGLYFLKTVHCRKNSV